MAIATGTAIALGVAAGTAGSSIYAAHRQGESTDRATQLQTDATNRATDAQTRANDEALQFQREDAERQRAEVARAEFNNYQQYLNRYRGAQTLGHTFGFDLPDALPYAGVTPGGGGGPTMRAAMPTIDASKGDLGSQISDYFKSQGVSDTETPYWIGKWNELEARGRELNDPNYANKRLQQADIFGGGGPMGSGTSAARTPQNLSTLFDTSGPQYVALPAFQPRYTLASTLVRR